MNKVYYSRDEMQKINTEKLLERGVTIEEDEKYLSTIIFFQRFLYNLPS